MSKLHESIISRLSSSASKYLTDRTYSHAVRRISAGNIEQLLSSAAVAAIATPPDVDVGDVGGPASYFVVEVKDGEWPLVKTFKTLATLTRFLRSIDGEDTTVSIFHGSYIPITVGPQRYLILPDGETAVSVANAVVVDVNVIDGVVPIQEDGFLGPEYLANNSVMTQAPRPKKRNKKRRLEEPDDDSFDENQDDASA